MVAGLSASAEIKAARGVEALAASQSPSLFGQPQAAVAGPTAEQIATWVRQENRDSIVPVSANDWKVSFVADDAVVKRLELARALLARQFPEARLEDMLGALLEMFLEKNDPSRRAVRRREKAAGAGKPAQRGPKPIPRAIRDAVLERDGQRCTFEGPEGRCLTRRRLELDHIVPRALGGADTAENLRSMCPTHNRFLAKLVFGAAYVEQAIAQRRSARDAPA